MGSFSTRWQGHRIVAFALVFATLSAASVYGALASPPEEIAPEFQEFHSESGGVRIFGYALSPRVLENDRLVQYFERQRMEQHPENQHPYNVQLGRLGAEEASARGLKGAPAFERLGPDEAGDSCLYFEETGHQVCAGFKQHWEGHGLNFGDAGISQRESIALFGYPISREFTDPDTGLTVQYFERAMFEYHDEYAGTEYHVLLRRSGEPLWEQRAGSAVLAPEPAPEAQTVAETSNAPSGVGQQIADLGQSLVGSPYVWGATGPNAFDCTGFTYYVVNQVVGGYSRDMFTQAATGTPVSRDDLQPGDIVFQQNTYRAGLSHAGIYIGGGKFVNAANPGTGVTVSNLWDDYWGPRFHSARRMG